jgi:membrane protease YdiL (CAAX protease family)
MQTQPEVKTAHLLFIAFWLIVFLFILLFGRFFPKVRAFRSSMYAKWKPALVITILYYLGSAIAGNGLINPYILAIFSQAMIGLAIADGIEEIQPLPVTDAIVKRKKIFKQILLLIVISVLIVIPVLLIGSVGMDIGKQIFNETSNSQEAANMIIPNKWMAFFMLLSGAGIAEETTYRLVILTLLWKLTKRRWPAIILSAMLFGAYHLLPLSSMYMVFRQFPISQFLGSTFIGIVWGYLYVKRGYESAVLGHTFSDWLPWVLFSG